VHEHPILVVGTAESKRSVEEPGFDAEAYEQDRLLFISEGMLTITSP
jgi:hypothetical protein